MSVMKKISALQKLNQYKPLLNELVVRDLKLKYRRSFLGYIWSLLNPLLMMTFRSLLFSYMFRFDIPNYPL
ncbi:MAG: ABC transporter permease, partial [Oscillospiraceae bacterium]|nr:ABC transporter permease [Oscillospiraceae bacterium]